MQLVQRIEQTILQEQLLKKDTTIVLAVSGGPDSVALLHALDRLSDKWRWKLVVAHINHQFRGEESDNEALGVQEMARKLGWPCIIANIDVPAYVKANALNPQVAAREKRYQILLQTAEQFQATSIVLAHHADDQAETVLMRVIKGTGPSGLSGIPIRRMEGSIEIVRPLLHIYKEELLAFCESEQITYFKDSSNDDRKYFRNQVRLDIIPALKSYNPSLVPSLHRLSVLMQDEDRFMQQQTKATFEQMVSSRSDGYGMSRASFMNLAVALQRRLIKLILSYLSEELLHADFVKIESVREGIIQPLTPTMSLDLSERVRFARDYDNIYFHQTIHTSTSAEYDSSDVYEYNLESDLSGDATVLLINEIESTLKMRLISKEQWEYESRQLKLDSHRRLDAGLNWSGEVFFDYDRLSFPLVLRNRVAGDRIALPGLNGRKKVKDMFIDLKITMSKRNRWPILLDQSGSIVWIPGIRRSNAAWIDEQTERVLHIQMISTKPTK